MPPCVSFKPDRIILHPYNRQQSYSILALTKIPKIALIVPAVHGFAIAAAGLSAVGQNAIIRSDLLGNRTPNLPAKARRRPVGGTKAAMTEEEERELRVQLARLQQEHRDLDAAIAALQETPSSDLIQVQRLKKRKLQLRDRITFIEDQLTPDIIA
jgi:hypothetical protein